MIAMQYSFTLPANYDMSIVDRRIRDNGYKLDGFQSLLFKAYLVARIGELGSHENQYAPFYLWHGEEGMDAFLTGPGFKGVSQAFGWPSVSSWLTWHQSICPHIRHACFAVRHVSPIAPHVDLSELRESAISRAKQQIEAGALASVMGFEPSSWSLVEFSLRAEQPEEGVLGQKYKVGYVAC